MPSTSHRVVGVIEVDSLDNLALLQPPARPEESKVPRPLAFAGTVMIADIHQLAADLVIELEHYQRQTPCAC